jgi:glutaredoxin 1
MKCVIYGRGNCSFCKRAVELAKQLQGHGYGEYQYIDIVAAGIDKQKLSEMVGKP